MANNKKALNHKSLRLSDKLLEDLHEAFPYCQGNDGELVRLALYRLMIDLKKDN